MASSGDALLDREERAWESRRHMIRRLFLAENMTIHAVLDELRSQGFEST